MSLSSSSLALRRPQWIAFVVTDVVLFLLANVTAKNASHPGTVSNIFWVAFLIGTALLLMLAVVVVVRRVSAR